MFWISRDPVGRGIAMFLNHAPGRGLYAVGGNPVAARYCGIDASPAPVAGLCGLAGAIAGLCGYLWVSRYGIAYTDIAPAMN